MRRYTSIPAEGIFFKEEEFTEEFAVGRCEGHVVNLFDDVAYQSMLGFGGAFTESAAYNYAQLTAKQKKQFMESLYTRDKGIGYNFGRMHINSCDFALDIYTYVENGDTTLETFNIERDEKYIIPMVKDAMQYADEEIFLFASPWSPPAYMKDNESPIRGGVLKEEFKAVWALYYAKYIQAMAKHGIVISGITIQNEPLHHAPWESCYYSAEDEREFIEKYLAPTLDREGLGEIKIIIWDHNKERVYDRPKRIFQSREVFDRVWAIGHHWYSGDHFDGLRICHEQFGKPLISTEFCGDIRVDVNALAERYAREMILDSNNYTAGFCDWNLMLSTDGGPYHNRNSKTPSRPGIIYEDKSSGCYAPVLYDRDKNDLVYTPIYYYIGHFSKFVMKGARRLGVSSYHPKLYCTAFQNPDGSIVFITLNSGDYALPACVRHQDNIFRFEMPAHSIMTHVL